MAVSESEEAAQPAIARIHGDRDNFAILTNHFEAVVEPATLFCQAHINDAAIITVAQPGQCKRKRNNLAFSQRIACVILRFSAPARAA